MGDSFVGRELEVAAVRCALGAARVVTIVGTAGIGKTRLAREAVGGAAFGAPDRAWFCDLASATSANDLLAIVETALGVDPVAEDRMQAIGRALRARGEGVVVFDSAEPIAEATALAIAAWLRAAPELRVLVTSRERLRLRGEHVVEVDSLEIPRTRDEVHTAAASRLLLERARAQRHAPYALSDAEALWKLSVALEGIPLAIELAAARLSVLEPNALLARIDERLDLLTHGTRDAPARHATLRDAIAWSWRFLPSAERRVLAQCSVFRGGFRLEAAEAILGGGRRSHELERADTNDLDVLDLLQSLCDKSLLRTSAFAPAKDKGRAPGRAQAVHPCAARFQLFESVRAFAAERLAEMDATEHAALVARFTTYFRRLARSGNATDIACERANLAALIERALAPRGAGGALEPSFSPPESVSVALETLVAMASPAASRLHEHLSSLLSHAVDLADDGSIDAVLRARGLEARGRARQHAGDVDGAQRDFEQAIDLAHDAGITSGVMAARTEVEALVGLGVLQHARRELDGARSLYARALDIARAVGDRGLEGRALANLAAALHDAAHFEEARALYLEALALLERAGDARLEGICCSNLGILDQEEGDFAGARGRFERAHALLRASGDRRLEAICIGDRASLHQEEGDLEEARAGHETSLQMLREVGDVRAEGLCLTRLGAVLAGLGRVDAAAGCFEEAEQMFLALADRTSFDLIDLSRAFVDITRAAEDGASASASSSARQAWLAAARARLARASARGARGGAPLFERSDDARRAARILEKALRRIPAAGVAPRSVLLLGKDGASYCPPDRRWRDLSHRRAARLLLQALVAQHACAPDVPLSLHALWGAGWPDERTVGDAWLNRIHVTLSYLRNHGLRAHLLRKEAGYLLDPCLDVEQDR